MSRSRFPSKRTPSCRGWPVRRPLEGDRQNVLAVEREMMANRQSSPGTERKLFAHAAGLHCQGRSRVGGGCRVQRGVADGESTDFPGRRQVSFQEQRREREGVGDVVEPVRQVVGRQQRWTVDLQRQQVPDRVGVLGAGQAVGRRTARVGIALRRPVERGLQPRAERRAVICRRKRHSLRRHHPGPELANHLLPDRGVATDPSQVQTVELDSGGLELPVVTADAVAIQEGPVRG